MKYNFLFEEKAVHFSVPEQFIEKYKMRKKFKPHQDLDRISPFTGNPSNANNIECKTSLVEHVHNILLFSLIQIYLL